MEVLGDDGGRLSFDAPAGGAGHLATICEESPLTRALWLACAMAPGIAHRACGFDSAIFPVDAGAGPAVKIRLDDGSQFDADLLLGADGRQSAVRAAAGMVSRHSNYGQTAIVANFTTQWSHAGIARQWFSQDGILALLPLPGNRVSLVWSAPDALAPSLLALPPEAFARRVAARANHVLGAMGLLGERHAFVLHRVVVDRLVRPGALLLGDAAHVVHPLAGQGLNLGLQDVAQLLQMLDSNEPWRRLGDVRCLRRYERARAEPIALMRATVDGLAGLFRAPDDRLRFLRNTGMSAVNALAPLKSALVRHAMG
jgi:ubiquinone biosynthesis UbiH/UbiF/VisC/COQ6 family hydroxylase